MTPTSLAATGSAGQADATELVSTTRPVEACRRCSTASDPTGSPGCAAAPAS